MQLYANPYEYGAKGFYFSSLEEADKKFAAAAKKGVEEFEIEFIDGTDAEAELFEAAHVNAATLPQYFELIDSLGDESEQAAVFYALEYLREDMPKALKLAEDELRPFQGDVKEYAYDYVDSIGGVSELGKDTIESYFDYEAFGRDLSYDLDPEEDAHLLELDDDERGEEYVDSIGGVAELGKTAENYFDYDAFARDLELGGDVKEFEFAGKTWTIPSY